MTGDRRARIFGEVVDQYDRMRPGYPDALIDTVLASTEPSGHVLEAGAGTGKATVLFAARGCAVRAVEPDARMAARCRENTARFPQVGVEDVRFEDVDVEQDAFDVVAAAQCWHWIEPEAGAERAARALRSGGVLALFWNRPGGDEWRIRRAIDDAYQRFAPDLVRSVANRVQPVDESLFGPLLTPARFHGQELYHFAWERTFTSDEYCELLETHSDHHVMPGSQLAMLLEAVHRAIEDAGGAFEYRYVTDLRLFRRR